jgi:hypothetical protein
MLLAYFELFSNICIVDITAILLFLNKSNPNFMKTLIKPSELNKRFVIIVLLLFTVLALIGLFAGCGNDDNVTGNNGNPPASEQLIFSLDSFSLYTSATGIQSINRTDTVPIEFDSCKITFESLSNCDSNSSIALRVFENNIIAFMRSYHEFNISNTIYDKAINPTGKKTLYLGLRIDNNLGGNKYLKIKNLKFYKIN